MSNRRDIVLGIGAGACVMALSFAAGAGRRHGLNYGFSPSRAPVDGIGGQALRCTAGRLTTRQIEGPFYTPKTPERRDIRDPLVGEALVLAGRVLDPQCRPLAGAVLDFWQTDHAGRYDNQGYRYRGHQHTDEAGRFELVTVRPHAYTAMNIFRTAHIHVKVQGARTALLTTQLYFPDAAETNARDAGYDAALAVEYVGLDGEVRRAAFDFVLASA